MGQYTTFPIPNRTITDYSKWIFPADFGVVSDGITDDTAALNAMFAAIAAGSNNGTATVIWPPGFCRTTDSVIVGTPSTSGPQTHCNIEGNGSDATSGIRYFGPTDRPALIVSRMTNCHISNMYILNGVGRGTTTGCLLGGRNNAADFGNLTNNVQFYSCNFEGWNTGTMCGGRFGAASEISFFACGWANNDTAFNASDFNSLDFVFVNCGLSGNTVGIDAGVSGGFHVLCGSGSFNGADFVVRQNAVCSIDGWRSEVAGNTLQGVNARKATISNCSGTSPAGAPGTGVSIGGSFTHMVARDCYLEGSISPTTPGYWEVSGCSLSLWDVANKLPVFLPTAGGQVLTGFGDFRGNRDIGAFPPRPINDARGQMGARFNGVSVVAFGESFQTVVGLDTTITTDYGVSYLALSHVRSLGEGTLPGVTASTPTTGKNLRVRTTFGASGTANFAFSRALTTTGSGGALLTATVGTFTQADVGKKVKITAGADTGADWYGYVTDFLTSTTVNVFPAEDPSTPGQRYPNQPVKATVVGEDEPDANYMVAGLVGNVNETFWVTAIASTGFTFNSSNGASTATVTALIVR